MVFKKIIFQNRYVALETPSRPPPPFMANAILNFHFDFLKPSLMTFLRSDVNQFKRVINFLFVGHDFFLLCKFTYKWLAPLVSLKSSCNPIRANVSSIAVTLAFLCARGMNL